MDDSLIECLAHKRLTWLPELDIGWYPVTESPYDDRYWSRYREMDQTAIGAMLTERRLAFVAKHWNGPLVDIGIGGGRFVKERGKDAKGFDINPNAINWLRGHGKWFNPYEDTFPVATFWDSLEHIHNPEPILQNVTNAVFISTPIYRDAAHVLQSKHFRPTEHCWYFTANGLRAFMKRFGFRMSDRNRMEQQCGREDIETFVFERFNNGRI